MKKKTIVEETVFFQENNFPEVTFSGIKRIFEENIIMKTKFFRRKKNFRKKKEEKNFS